MSPEACRILTDEIMPIITSTIPRLRLVGSDDHQELTQDAVASAAQMLDQAERAGRPLLGKSTAFYAIQRCKSGRRSGGNHRVDAMSAGAQLDGNAVCISLAEPVGGRDGDENMTLGDMLAGDNEDSCVLAARSIDWAWYLGGLDACDADIVHSIAVGETASDVAQRWNVSSSAVCQRKGRVGRMLMARSGGQAMQDAMSRPLWEGGIRACREASAARYERRGAMVGVQVEG